MQMILFSSDKTLILVPQLNTDATANPVKIKQLLGFRIHIQISQKGWNLVPRAKLQKCIQNTALGFYKVLWIQLKFFAWVFPRKSTIHHWCKPLRSVLWREKPFKLSGPFTVQSPSLFWHRAEGVSGWTLAHSSYPEQEKAGRASGGRVGARVPTLLNSTVWSSLLLAQHKAAPGI